MICDQTTGGDYGAAAADAFFEKSFYWIDCEQEKKCVLFVFRKAGRKEGFMAASFKRAYKGRVNHAHLGKEKRG